ncbi:MAG: glycosyltransferase [Verrucomicrobia bacterium]|nr:glycosyltransferase [Verrucomicrobiota bacterium]
MKRYFKICGLVVAMATCFAWGALSYPLFGWKTALPNFFVTTPKEPHFAVLEHKPFVIIIPSYNNTEWVEKNLVSVFRQKYDNYRVIYIDDASTDGTLARVNELIARENMPHRVDVIHNETNKGACENIYRAVHTCRDEEIALVLDGDDWFAHDRVLQRLNEVYADPDIWMTYGSYIEYPSYGYTVANFSQPLPKKVIQKNSVRDYTRTHWCLSQMRTFYSSLFKKIKTRDLQWEGKYYDATYDLAFMIPMAEMAGEHVKFLKEILYIYNRATPLNDNKVRAQRQKQVAQHILEQPCYARLSSLSSDGCYIEDRR